MPVSTAPHRGITHASGHIVHSLEYADTAAREGAGLAPADVGRIARQLDTGAFYILEDDSPLSWRALGDAAPLVYADEAARLAATLAAGDVGRLAQQSDTGAWYVLSAAPSTWVRIDRAPDMLVYADEAARTGATVTLADIGRIAQQSDTAALYILQDNAPTWLQLTDGALVTYANEAARLAATPPATWRGRIVQQVDTERLYALRAESPLVWDPLGGAYAWTWADAAARAAQSVTAADIGRLGYQSDIRLQFQLVAVTPATMWAPLPDPRLGTLQSHIANPAAGVSAVGMSTANSGTFTGRTISNTSIGESLSRIGVVSGSGAGSVAMVRSGAIALVAPFRSLHRVVWVPGASTAARYFAGVCYSVDLASNQDPAAFVDCYGIGRPTGAANLHFIRNNSSGPATTTNLGAAFPANTPFIAWELRIAFFGGSDWAFNVRNMVSGAEISGAHSTEVPSGGLNNVIGAYANNHTDAVAVSLDLSVQEIQQFAVR